jgi:DNA-binding ferritin-like protein
MSKTTQLPHATAIDLPSKNRAELAEILNQQLANVSDLQSQTKQAHWNVRGPEFYQLHKLFDDLAEPLGEHIDTIAERTVTLGGFALGTVRCAANSSELDEFPLEPGAMEYARELAKALRSGATRSRCDQRFAESGGFGYGGPADRPEPPPRQGALFPGGSLSQIAVVIKIDSPLLYGLRPMRISQAIASKRSFA